MTIGTGPLPDASSVGAEVTGWIVPATQTVKIAFYALGNIGSDPVWLRQDARILRDDDPIITDDGPSLLSRIRGVTADQLQDAIDAIPTGSGDVTSQQLQDAVQGAVDDLNASRASAADLQLLAQDVASKAEAQDVVNLDNRLSNDIANISLTPGPAGADGMNAYELAVVDGFVGTRAEWRESLRGPAGAGGSTPLSDDPDGNDANTAATTAATSALASRIAITDGKADDAKSIADAATQALINRVTTAQLQAALDSQITTDTQMISAFENGLNV